MIEQLKSDYKANKYREVIKAGQLLMKQRGKSEELLLLLAKSYLKTKNYTKAKEYAEQSIEIGRNKSISYSIIAAYYISAKNYQKASKYLDMALSLKPDLKEALFNYGVLYYNKGELDIAFEKIKQLIKSYPEFGLGYLMMGFIQHQKKQFKDAREYYKKARYFDNGLNTLSYIIGTYLHFTPLKR